MSDVIWNLQASNGCVHPSGAVPANVVACTKSCGFPQHNTMRPEFATTVLILLFALKTIGEPPQRATMWYSEASLGATALGSVSGIGSLRLGFLSLANALYIRTCHVNPASTCCPQTFTRSIKRAGHRFVCDLATAPVVPCSPLQNIPDWRTQ
jgi:hypothetical protein